MTLIAGICNEFGGSIVSDNMVTYNKDVKSIGASTTGQSFDSKKNDSAFKLNKLSDNCVLSFAGSVETGQMIILKLKEIIDYSKQNIEETLQSITNTKDRNTSFLICFYDDKTTSCYLLKWMSNDTSKFEYGNYFTLGSGTSVLEDINPNLIDDLLKCEAETSMKGAAISHYYNQKLIHRVGKELSIAGV